MKYDLVDVDVYLFATTGNAILVGLDKHDRKRGVWLPKSQIEYEPKRSVGMDYTVTLPEWLAIDKELV